MGNSQPEQRSRITEAQRQKPDPNHLVDGKYAIADLVDLAELKQLFQGFSEATGFTIGFLDHPGLNVLIATGWLDICTQFHRANPRSICGCLKSNRHLLGQLSRPLQTNIEKCEHGLVDCATPIIIKGRHIASLATGQLLLAQPDRERFRRQAAAYDYDEKAYLAALEQVKVVDEGQLQRVTAFLGTLAQMISEKGYVNLLLKEKAGRLQAEIEERERLEEEVVKSVEREQERIGRDLHDGLCQMLVGAKYHACILQRISKRQFPEVKQQAGTLEGVLDQTIAYARDLSRSLNPARITPANLVGALQRLAASVDDAKGARCSCQLKLVELSDHQAAEQVYRIAQEAVQNAVKHARAKNISIRLTSQDGRTRLSVQDDGLGIALRRKRGGMGLRNMETRARLIGGRLEVVRRERGGTTVSCEFVQPIRKPA